VGRAGSLVKHRFLDLLARHADPDDGSLVRVLLGDHSADDFPLRSSLLLIHSLVDDVLRHRHELDLLDDLVNLLVGEGQVSGQLLARDVDECREKRAANGVVGHCALVVLVLQKLLEDEVARVLEYAVLELLHLLLIELWQLLKAKLEAV